MLTTARVTSRSRTVPNSGNRHKGKYANYFEVGHNAFEFVIDFGQYEGKDVAWHSRVIVNPNAARALLDVLQRSIEEYGRRYPAPADKHGSGD